MMTIRPIRTEADYDAVLDRISYLMDSDDQESVDELDVLSTLVEKYEDANHAVDLPDPVDAILFRMEQQELTRADLKAHIGSSAKVSEVLSRKRPLTLKMIRALNGHLGIPANVLIGEQTGALPTDLEEVVWDRFPIAQMAKQNWISSAADMKDRAEEVLRNLIKEAGGPRTLSMALYRDSSMGLYRKNDNARRNARMDPYALQAWCLHVLAQARRRGLEGIYRSGSINSAFLREVARISVFAEGPKLALEFLAKNGIALVYARHLPKTYLDGAAMFTKEGVPVVGVTIRYDRIDSFWFCLLHELAHIGWHLTDDNDYIVDDLTLNRTEHGEDWEKEDEADALAQESLIPSDLWNEHMAGKPASPSAVISLAQLAGVHPAIVAGRVRKESENYRLLSQFVGTGEVRRQFEEMSHI